jgi:TP901 family phage tail tape measure protein
MPFIIPTIFTAADKSFSSTVGKMHSKLAAFGTGIENNIAKAEHAMHKFTPVLSDAGKELFRFAKVAAIAAAIVGTIEFSKEKIIEYEKATAHLRNRLTELTDVQFKAYRAEVFKVAEDTHKSSIEMTEAFDKVLSLNKKFGETAEGLGKVSKAAVILSEASGNELPQSAEQLVGVMNQFSLAADQADRVINALAAGQKEGAASIQEITEGLTKFAPAAKGANISLEQSIGLLDLLSKYEIKGADAGGVLRMTIVRLQKAGIGYVNGQFDIHAALEKTHEALSKVSNAKIKDAWLTKVFGARNVATARILLDNTGVYDELTKSITGTGDAYEMAERNADTLGVKIERLKNKFTNIITGADGSSEALDKVKKSIVFLTDHMEGLLDVAGKILIVFGLWWGVIILLKTLTGIITILTAVTWLWNAALALNPMVLIVMAIILAIAALVAIISLVVKNTEGWGEQWDAIMKFMKASFDFLMYALILGWLLLKDQFLSFTEAIVSAWNWAQNKLGLLSDEQYEREKKQIADQRRQRLEYIANTVTAMGKAAATMSEGIEWKLRARTDMDDRADQWDNDHMPFPQRQVQPAFNPKTAQNDALTNQLFTHQFGKTSAELVIKDETGRAKINKNKGMNIKLTPTLGQFDNENEDNDN